MFCQICKTNFDYGLYEHILICSITQISLESYVNVKRYALLPGVGIDFGVSKCKSGQWFYHFSIRKFEDLTAIYEIFCHQCGLANGPDNIGAAIDFILDHYDCV